VVCDPGPDGVDDVGCVVLAHREVADHQACPERAGDGIEDDLGVDVGADSAPVDAALKAGSR
jgi:hypothetical protein